MPTSEDYKQMANRTAQLAIAARLGQAAEMQQDPAGFGD